MTAFSPQIMSVFSLHLLALPLLSVLVAAKELHGFWRKSFQDKPRRVSEHSKAVPTAEPHFTDSAALLAFRTPARCCGMTCRLPQTGFKIGVEGRIEAQVKFRVVVEEGRLGVGEASTKYPLKDSAARQLPEIPLTGLCVELIIRKLYRMETEIFLLGKY